MEELELNYMLCSPHFHPRSAQVYCWVLNPQSHMCSIWISTTRYGGKLFKPPPITFVLSWNSPGGPLFAPLCKVICSPSVHVFSQIGQHSENGTCPMSLKDVDLPPPFSHQPLFFLWSTPCHSTSVLEPMSLCLRLWSSAETQRVNQNLP